MEGAALISAIGKPHLLRASRLLAGTLGVVVLVACSSGPSKGSTDQGALDTVFQEIRPSTAEWAATLAAELQRRRQDGEIDMEAMRGLAGRTGMPLSDSICTTIKENDSIANSEEDAESAKEVLHDFVDREVMVAIAKYPVLLYDLKVQWPPSWLLDRSRQPDYTAPIEGINPEYLKASLRPEFVAGDGSAVLPDRGSKEYENFLAWKHLAKNNTLAARGYALSGTVDDAITDCIDRLSD